MPKQKTRRAAAKRFKVMANGRIKCGRAGKRHLLSGKTTKRKRQLRTGGKVPPGLIKMAHAQIPYA